MLPKVLAPKVDLLTSPNVPNLGGANEAVIRMLISIGK